MKKWERGGKTGKRARKKHTWEDELVLERKEIHKFKSKRKNKIFY